MFYKWKPEYRAWLRARIGEDVADLPDKKDKEEFSMLKTEIEELNKQVAEMKQDIGSLRKMLIRPGVVVDSVSIVAIILGCMIGMFVTVCTQAMK